MENPKIRIESDECRTELYINGESIGNIRSLHFEAMAGYPAQCNYTKNAMIFHQEDQQIKINPVVSENSEYEKGSLPGDEEWINRVADAVKRGIEDALNKLR